MVQHEKEYCFGNDDINVIKQMSNPNVKQKSRSKHAITRNKIEMDTQQCKGFYARCILYTKPSEQNRIIYHTRGLYDVCAHAEPFVCVVSFPACLAIQTCFPNRSTKTQHQRTGCMIHVHLTTT